MTALYGSRHTALLRRYEKINREMDSLYGEREAIRRVREILNRNIVELDERLKTLDRDRSQVMSATLDIERAHREGLLPQ